MTEVVRLSDLTADQRRVVLALIEAGESQRKEGGPAMVAIAEPSIHFPMQTAYRVVSGIESIGPEEAEAILSRNTHNRPPKRTPVETFARAMTEGRWELNGESIKIASDGTLLDGQHRLAAVVLSGVSIQTVVVRGLPPKAQETIDTGVKRSVADMLVLRGEAHATTVASALRYSWLIDHNGHLFSGVGYAYPSAEELLDYLDAHPGVRESAQVGYRLNGGVLRYPPSMATTLHYLMGRRDTEQADEFWNLLNDGVGLLYGHPILTLRNYLVRDLSNRRRMDATVRAAYTIKAWNAYRANRALHVIKWTRSGDKREDFPAIK